MKGLKMVTMYSFEFLFIHDLSKTKLVRITGFVSFSSVDIVLAVTICRFSQMKITENPATSDDDISICTLLVIQ